MSQERLYHVLLGTHVSEKAVVEAEDKNQYVFKVLPNASKIEIKEAIELLFDVKVDTVRTLNVKGKQKSFARRMGKRSDWKKAYIRLAEGQSFDTSNQ